MLIEVMCDKFTSHGKPRGRISLHAGLNTILGSDSGSNSIGKSTFLMIIDFAFGGDDYIEKLADVQTEVGEHRICFAFQFTNRIYYFSRSNVDYKNVQKCDEDYRPLEGGLISLNQYLSFLQTHYDMDLSGLSFRNAVGRSMRIYKRETLDEEHPLHQAKQEKAQAAIEGLLKLADLYSGIVAQSRITAEATDKYSTFRKAQKYQYIPFITKQSEYEQNETRIAELTEQAEELARKSSSGLLDLDSMQAEQLSIMQGKLSNFKRQKSRLLSQLRAIRADQDWGKRGFKRNYDDLLRFFPEVDLQRIEAIENFHKKLANILKKEFAETEENMQATLALIETEMTQIEAQIAQMTVTTDLSKTVLEQYAAIDKELKTLRAANENYIKTAELAETAKAYKAELDRLVVEQIAIMQQEINGEMKRINDVIYSGRKTAPTLTINDASHYVFFTPRDGGTGTQYKGLVVFDLAMLSLTRLPVIAHDSVMLKHIEDEAMEKIIELYADTQKQVFIAMDKEGSYTSKTQKIMEDTKVLHLGPGDGALFGRTWNDENVEQ